MATLVIRMKTEMARAALELAIPTIEMMFKEQGKNMGIKAKDVKINVEE